MNLSSLVYLYEDVKLQSIKTMKTMVVNNKKQSFYNRWPQQRREERNYIGWKRISIIKVQCVRLFFINEEAESDWVTLTFLFALELPKLIDDMLAFCWLFVWLPDDDDDDDVKYDDNDSESISGIDDNSMGDDWVFIDVDNVDSLPLFFISFITLHRLTAFRCL